MTDTIAFYNNNAEQYYESTIRADFRKLREEFCSYLPENARIVDVGCGSGRDVKAFCDMGYRAVGLDASTELAQLAQDKLGIKVIVADMAIWLAEEPFDAIWCCASLLHLQEEKVKAFFQHLKYNLKPGGIIFLSVKEGIVTGQDEKGRYMRNYTEAELCELITHAGLEILKINRTDDKLGRKEFTWLNVFARKEE